MAHGFGYRSEQRLRKENQDTFGVFEFGDVCVLVVCDGMGGHVGGRQASSIAVRTIHDELAQFNGGDVRAALRRAIEAANRAIYEMARKNYRLMGMGTTCVAVAVQGNVAHVAHVGDSRAYLVRDGQIRALTRDHTMVNLFVDAELLSPEDAATHPEAHVLSRSLGVERQVEVDLAEPLPLQQNDRLLLCSDGVHGVLGNSGLGNIDWRNPQEGVDAALAAVERAAGDDNATLVAFGLGISGTSAPPTPPPDLASLEEEARQAPVQVALQPVRRPQAAPPPSADVGSTAHFDEDVVPIEDLDPEPPTTPEPKARVTPPPPRRKPGRSGGGRKPLLLAAGALAALAVAGGVAAFALRGSGGKAPVPAVAVPPVATSEQALAAVEPEADEPLDDENLSSAGTSGMVRSRCLDCTSSLVLPTAAVYLSSDGDPEVAVAFFAPDVPPAPKRIPNTQSTYDRPPPAGPEQTKAVRAARNKRCREALDTVQEAIAKSMDYASLYGAAWWCFTDTDSQVLSKARAATWEEFLPLLAHFEGTRPVPADTFPTPAASSDGTEAARPRPADLPDTWMVPATGGIEYRLLLFELDSDVQGFRDIVVDLLGEASVADHLAVDVLLEAHAAAAVARMENPDARALQVWARRVYVASRAMTGPVGELIRAHRPEVAGMIEALLFEATGGDEGLLAIEEGYVNEAIPPVVARAQAAGLAGTLPDFSGDAVVTADLVPDGGLYREEPEWRSSTARRPPRSRGSYTRSRSSASEDARRASTSSAQDWENFGYLKVWYPRQRMPRVLVPWQQQAGEAVERSQRAADYDAVEVHRRSAETLDPDWGPSGKP